MHRDLKPENILFNAKGEALLADFGIAKMLDTIGVRQGTIIGTPSYMAPEQFRGIGSRESDQYALGCIAYELFTGHKPFIAPDMAALMFKHLMEQPVALGQIAYVPEEIEQVVLKALAKERESRYTDIISFVKALYEEFLKPRKSAKRRSHELEVYLLRLHEKFLQGFEEMIRLMPDDAISYVGKGLVLRDLGRYEEALGAFQQAIHLDPNDAYAYNSKGHALEQLGRKEEAQQAYEKARQLGYEG